MEQYRTYEEDVDKHALNMKSWFLEGEYVKQMIDAQMWKVKFGQRSKIGSKSASIGVSCVTTKQPKLKKLAQIMKKLEHVLYQDESVKRELTLAPQVS